MQKESTHCIHLGILGLVNSSVSTQISGSFGSIAFKEEIISNCQLSLGQTFSVGNVIFWSIFIGHKYASSNMKFWTFPILATVV